MSNSLPPAFCKDCKILLGGTWSISASKTLEQMGRQVGTNEGYFLGSLNTVYCYCQSCWQKNILALPFVKNLGSQQSVRGSSDGQDPLRGFNHLSGKQEFLNQLALFETNKQKEDNLAKELRVSLIEKKLDYQTEQQDLLNQFIFAINSVMGKYNKQIFNHCNTVQEKLEIELTSMRNQQKKIDEENQEIYDDKTLNEVANQLQAAINAKQNLQQKWRDFRDIHQESEKGFNLQSKSILSSIEDDVTYSEEQFQPKDQVEYLNTYKQFYNNKKYEETLNDYIIQRLVKSKLDFTNQEKTLMVETIKLINQIIKKYQTDLKDFSMKACVNVEEELRQMKIKLNSFEEENQDVFDATTIKLIKSQLETAVIAKEIQVSKWRLFEKKTIDS